jgi:hypothetical protein
MEPAASLSCSQELVLASILSQMTQVHTKHPISVRSILMFFSHLRLGLPSCIFPSRFPTKPPYACLVCSMHATSVANFILFDLIILIIQPGEHICVNISLCWCPDTVPCNIAPSNEVSVYYVLCSSKRSGYTLGEQVIRMQKCFPYQVQILFWYRRAEVILSRGECD